VISQIWEVTTAKRMKIYPYCHHCSPLNVLYSDYVDIAELYCAKGLQSEYSGRKGRKYFAVGK